MPDSIEKPVAPPAGDEQTYRGPTPFKPSPSPAIGDRNPTECVSDTAQRPTQSGVSTEGGYEDRQLDAAIGDVEKLIERVQEIAWADYKEENPLTGEAFEYNGRTIMEAAAMLRSLADEHKEDVHSNLKLQDENEALRAEKAKVEEQANNLKRYVGEYASEIDALRAKLERASRILWEIPVGLPLEAIEGQSGIRAHPDDMARAIQKAREELK